MPEDISFAALLTAAGAGIAGAIVTTATELLKSVVGEPLSGRAHQVAFLLSGVLYAIAGVAVGVDTLDEALVVFLAWLTCATAAVGVYATLRTVRAG
jgi:hypothetical protein